MKCINKIIGVLISLLLLSSCGSVPLTGRKQILLVSDAELLTASLTQYEDYMKVSTKSTDKVKSAMVERVGKRIATATENYLKQNGMEREIANFRWEFNLMRDEAVNAFCMPGGKIVVYEGLLPLVSSEDELAVVVGHEVAHAVAKHSNERMSQEILTHFGVSFVDMALSNRTEVMRQVSASVLGLGSQLVVTLPYSRKHECEADEIGLIFMTLAGYDPGSALTFWKKMEALSGNSGSSDFLSTHPSDSKRIAEIQKLLPEMQKYKP